MDDATLDAILDAIGPIVRRAIDEAPIPQLQPATVLGWDEPSYTVTVRLDGEVHEVGAPLIGTVAPEPGQRCLVLLDPPHGAWVLGYIRSLEGAFEPPPVPPPDIVFGAPGAVATGSSEAVRPRTTLQVAGLSVTLATAGTTTTTVRLLRNGVVVATVTLAAAAVYNAITFAPVTYTARVDSMAVQVSTAGTGAIGLGGVIELA